METPLAVSHCGGPDYLPIACLRSRGAAEATAIKAERMISLYMLLLFFLLVLREIP